jgi:hypothetical protein
MKLIAVLLAVAAVPTAVAAQRQAPAETTAAASRTPGWMPPKTPWGQPDLQGVWTSDDMRSVPLNRPDQFAGRESLTPEEFAKRAMGDEGARDRAVNKETVLRNEWGVRTFGYTSLVTDPADGRVPALTPAAALRRANRDQGTFGPGPFDGPDDFTLYDRCITRGIVGSVLPVLYGNGLRILQTPDVVVISYEMIHDTRIIPLDGRSMAGPTSVRGSVSTSATRAAASKATRWSSRPRI